MMTHGISSGSTSASMLIDSVLALHVGAAASSSLSRDIMYCGKFGSMALYNASAAVSGISVSGYKYNVTSCQQNGFKKVSYHRFMYLTHVVVTATMRLWSYPSYVYEFI